MKTASEYMTILAKVMRNKSSICNLINKDKYNKLNIAIHSEFNVYLQNSIYPFTSDIIQKTESMIKSLDAFFLCPELINKKCISISSYITSKAFRSLKSIVDDNEFISNFKKIYTQIPYVIVNDEINSIEILNYANVRVRLSFEEFIFLVDESAKRKIALNKIIQFIIVKTKLFDDKLCVIVDNVYGEAKKMFWRSFITQLAYISDGEIKKMNKWNLKNYSALVVADNNLDKVSSIKELTDYSKVTVSGLKDYIEGNVKQVFYGFLDEFISIKTQITYFYENQMFQTKKMLNDVIGDIVRLGNSDDKILHSIRIVEEEKEKKLKKESNSIIMSINKIENLVLDIAEQLGDNVTLGKIVTRYTLDDIFESLFRCNNFNAGIGKKVLSRIYSFGYDDYNLINAYIRSLSEDKVQYGTVKIKDGEWEKAKMLIAILDLDDIPTNLLEVYVRVLGKRCSTGKELYAKAIVSSDRKKTDLLQESFNKGYSKAGVTLLQLYKNGVKSVNLMSLANALMPEACMMIAETKSNGNKNRYVDISNREFTYLKIAATKEYLPAIGKIVDIVFESRFSSGFQIPDQQVHNENYSEMISHGYLLNQLCRFLISKMYKVNHYSEVLGVVLFCLNNNHSEAMSLLVNSNSGLAYYCKGIMYEFGQGVTVDLDKALKNYELAMCNCFGGKASKRYSICLNKKEKFYRETNNYYNSDNDYHAEREHVRTEVVSDGCFAPRTKILMADGTYKNVEDIKVNDVVYVFDHYKAKLSKEKIVANVHDVSPKKEYNVIKLYFEDETQLDLVKTHILFNMSRNQYVLIEDNTVSKYIGDCFATYKDGNITKNKLIAYNIELKKTKYYMPISKFHLNVFAENILAMPPTELTLNMFDIINDMRYDVFMFSRYDLTTYDEVARYVTMQEYESLPLMYLKIVLKNKGVTIEKFTDIMKLYRN